MIRSPAVAGTFYPESAADLRAQVTSCTIEDEKARAERIRAIGVLVPHAGLIYSGPVAGKVYSRVLIPEVIVLLGPNHTGLGTDVSVFADGIWRMPMGDIAVESDLARSIIGRSPEAREDYGAHRGEHSLEVQIPFLQYFRSDVTIVPIIMRSTRLETCRAIGRAVAEAVTSYPKSVLLVASSDMTHFETDRLARDKDRLAIERVLDLDPEGLHDIVHRERISMCGFAPTVAMLFAARTLGAAATQWISYATSGDVSGDYDRVVGYAGIAIQ